MVQPTVLVVDPETGELVAPEELARRQAERALMRRAVEDRVSALLQGVVIQFTLTGNVCGTTVTLSGTGVIAAVGAGVAGPAPAVPRPGGAIPVPVGGGPGVRRTRP